MIKRLLVPIDGSECGARGLEIAVHIAKNTQCSLVLLHVVSLYTQFQPGSPEFIQAMSFTCAYTTESRRSLDELVDSDLLCNISVEYVSQSGPVVSTIINTASLYECDCIILCSHAEKERFSESIAEQVARYATIPVLIGREHGPLPIGQALDNQRPLRVLVGLDGSDFAEAVLQPTIALIDALAPPTIGAIHLTRIIHPAVDNDHFTFVIEKTKARDYLENSAIELEEEIAGMNTLQQEILVTWSIGVGYDVAKSLVHIAETGEDFEGWSIAGRCDLIALSTHGRGGIMRWLMGSVTEKVLSLTNLPMFVVRPAIKEKKPYSWSQDITQTVPVL